MKECLAVCIKNCYSARLCAFVTEFVQLDQIGPVFVPHRGSNLANCTPVIDVIDGTRLVTGSSFTWISRLFERSDTSCVLLSRVRLPRVRLVPPLSRTGLSARICHVSTRQSSPDYPSGFDSSNAVIPSPLYFVKKLPKSLPNPFLLPWTSDDPKFSRNSSPNTSEI